MTALVAVSCSNNKKGEDRMLSVKVGTASLNAGQTFQIQAEGGSGSYTYMSDNDYVAMVSPSGMVTAVRVGIANVTVSSAGHTAKVKVDVSPVSTLYIEPAMDWGSTRAQMIAKLGSPFDQGDDFLLYAGIAPADYYMYSFSESDRLRSVMVYIQSAYLAQVKVFLDERYCYDGYDSENNLAIYTNAINPANVTLLVGVGAVAPYYGVLYMPYDEVRSSRSVGDRFNSLFDRLNLD